MEPLTFSLVHEGEDAQPIRLTPCDAGAVSIGMWERLASDIAAEDTLMPGSAAALAARWLAGYAAAAIYAGQIISFIALVPVVHPGRGAPCWERLAAGVELRGAALPAISVFSFTNSWTAPMLRRQGISLSLRRPLIDRYLAGSALGTLDMDGLASPVPALLGWRIMPWDRVPFVSSLLSLPAREFPEQAARSWTSPLGLPRYQGPHVPLDAAGHPWGEYFYFWTANVALTETLEGQIRSLFCGDVRRWRSVVADVFAASEILWKVPFD